MAGILDLSDGHEIATPRGWHNGWNKYAKEAYKRCKCDAHTKQTKLELADLLRRVVSGELLVVNPIKTHPFPALEDVRSMKAREISSQAAAVFKEFISSAGGLMSTSIRLSKASHAARLYAEAKTHALAGGDMTQVLSITRCQGVVEQHLAKTLPDLASTKQSRLDEADAALAIKHSEAAIVFYSEAVSLKYSESIKSDESYRGDDWYFNLLDKIEETVEDLVNFVISHHQNLARRMASLERMTCGVDDVCITHISLPRFHIQLALANEVFKAIVNLDSTPDCWGDQLSMLKEMSRPLIEAEQQLGRLARLTEYTERVSIGAAAVAGGVRRRDDTKAESKAEPTGADVGAFRFNESLDIDLLGFCENGDLDDVARLLAAGANPNAAYPLTGVTALITSAREGYLEVVQILLSAKANAQKASNDGTTALSAARAKKRHSIVDVLERALTESNQAGARSPVKFGKRKEFKKPPAIVQDPEYSDFADERAKLSELSASRTLYLARCDSNRLLQQATQMKDRLLFQEEYLNMELVMECIVDVLKAAYVACLDSPKCGSDREDFSFLCHESAAAVCSALGVCYSKILKRDAEANNQFLSCVLHADIVTHHSGAQFWGTPWFVAAKNGIEAIRTNRIAEEARKRALEREEILARIAPQVEAIGKCLRDCDSEHIEKRAFTLLQFLRAKFPPSRRSSAAPASDPDPATSREAQRASGKTAGRGKPLCRFFTTTPPSCRHGDKCRFSHAAVCPPVSVSELESELRGLSTSSKTAPDPLVLHRSDHSANFDDTEKERLRKELLKAIERYECDEYEHKGKNGGSLLPGSEGDERDWAVLCEVIVAELCEFWAQLYACV